MADTMFAAHLADLKAVMTEIVRQYPWAYALVLILTSKLVNSQAAAVRDPVGLVALSIGVPRASWFPAPPPATAAASCRPTRPTWPLSSSTAPARRTSAGFVINHSFILPGLIGVLTATATGYVLGLIYGFI